MVLDHTEKEVLRVLVERDVAKTKELAAALGLKDWKVKEVMRFLRARGLVEQRHPSFADMRFRFWGPTREARLVVTAEV